MLSRILYLIPEHGRGGFKSIKYPQILRLSAPIKSNRSIKFIQTQTCQSETKISISYKREKNIFSFFVFQIGEKEEEIKIQGEGHVHGSGKRGSMDAHSRMEPVTVIYNENVILLKIRVNTK